MKPGEFQGVGCVLLSDIASIALLAGMLPPARLIKTLGEILEFQQQAILRHGGIVEQFVGNSVIAYWRPADPKQLAAKAFVAAQEILTTKIETAELNGQLKVSFSVNECAGAFFGHDTFFRFQVIGRARGRAERVMNESLRARSSAAVDAETFALFERATGDRFHPDSAGNFVFSGL